MPHLILWRDQCIVVGWPQPTSASGVKEIAYNVLKIYAHRPHWGSSFYINPRLFYMLNFTLELIPTHHWDFIFFYMTNEKNTLFLQFTLSNALPIALPKKEAETLLQPKNNNLTFQQRQTRTLFHWIDVVGNKPLD